MGYSRAMFNDGRARDTTPAEKRVIDLVADGSSNYSIAVQLGISEETVKRHISNIFDKLGIDSRYQLTVLTLKQRHEEEKQAIRRCLETFDFQSH